MINATHHTPGHLAILTLMRASLIPRDFTGKSCIFLQWKHEGGSPAGNLLVSHSQVSLKHFLRAAFCSPTALETGGGCVGAGGAVCCHGAISIGQGEVTFRQDEIGVIFSQWLLILKGTANKRGT